MKIGVLGSGTVGQVLGGGFTGLGHAVMIGSRSPESDELKHWKAQNGARASTGSFAEAARFGDVLILATLGSAAESAIGLAGKEHFAGKVLIDVTNPLDFSGDAPTLFVGWNDSLGERVQRWLPDARVVKAFNTVGNAHMVKPQFPGGPPTMFFCGNDARSKQTVARILSDFGWESVDIGAIDGARELESLCILWVKYAIQMKTRDHAFKMLRK